nr:MAG TPA: hypothetical protein [Caudoviricetes sp.]
MYSVLIILLFKLFYRMCVHCAYFFASHIIDLFDNFVVGQGA